MASTFSQIEILRSPAQVREVFLDFAKMHEWTQGFIRSIEPTPPKASLDLKEGDKMKVTLEGATFNPIILENSEHQFKWRGSIPYIFTGDHYFRFEPSQTTPGATNFVQGEDFSGALAFLMKLPFGMGGKQEKGFEGFNHDLKVRCESHG